MSVLSLVLDTPFVPLDAPVTTRASSKTLASTARDGLEMDHIRGSHPGAACALTTRRRYGLVVAGLDAGLEWTSGEQEAGPFSLVQVHGLVRARIKNRSRLVSCGVIVFSPSILIDLTSQIYCSCNQQNLDTPDLFWQTALAHCRCTQKKFF